MRYHRGRNRHVTRPSATVLVMSEPDHALPTGFGTPTATFIVVSSMVGVGVLTTSGFTVLSTGSNAVMLGLWAVGAYLLSGAVCTLAALAVNRRLEARHSALSAVGDDEL